MEQSVTALPHQIPACSPLPRNAHTQRVLAPLQLGIMLLGRPPSKNKHTGNHTTSWLGGPCRFAFAPSFVVK